MNHIALVAISALAGAIGGKIATSKPVRKVCVKGIVQGMKVKEQCESLVEDAKAEFDDLMAEAEYEKDAQDEAKEEPEAEPEAAAEEPAKPAKKARRTRAKSAKAADAE